METDSNNFLEKDPNDLWFGNKEYDQLFKYNPTPQDSVSQNWDTQKEMLKLQT